MSQAATHPDFLDRMRAMIANDQIDPKPTEPGGLTVPVLVCGRCGFERTVAGPSMRLCPDCLSTSAGELDAMLGRSMAAALTDYRLAIEQASAALALGKIDQAQQALDRCRQAPYQRLSERRVPAASAVQGQVQP